MMQPTPDKVNDLFVYRSAAQRYATARPNFHPLVAELISGFTGETRFSYALDVACGTGQSAHALTGIADRVAAIDIAPEMVAEAQSHERISFKIAPAETLPFPDDTFELITVGSALHWFERAAFMQEARRVLRSGAWLVVYTSYFTGEMEDNEDFRQWSGNVYTRQFPTPARHSMSVSAELVEPHGFNIHGSESFAHPEVMSVEQLTNYLLTQTNTIAAVEGGSMLLDDAASWIAAGIAPFFTGEHATMRFAGDIWYLK